MATILLVDTDPERSRGIHKSFEAHAGWKLIEASSGEEGRHVFQEQSVDLVIIDLASVGPPGKELFEWIRDDQSRVPVVLLTADEMDEETRVKALVMGAASYVPQSYVARDLVVTVERLLGLSGCRRRHARMLESLVSTETSFRIDDNDLALTSVVIGHIVDTTEEFGIATAKNRVQIAVALEEAITNGIVHGNLGVSSELRNGDGRAFHRQIEQRRGEEPYASRRLFMRCEFEPEFCRIAIEDEGDGFDPAAVDDPTELKNLDKAHGRGLFLIRAFMDEVTFNETGNVIILTKRVSSEPAFDTGC